MRIGTAILSLMLLVGLAAAAPSMTATGPTGSSVLSALIRPGEGVLSSTPASSPQTDPPGDTLHVDLDAFNNAVGLTAGGTFYSAARLTATQACSVSAVIFYRWNNPVNDYLFVWAGNTSTQPGAIIESVPFSSLDSEWNRIELTTKVALNNGADIWVGPRITTGTQGVYCLGVDDGPYVATRGDWINYQGSWEELGPLGLSMNWHIRAITGAGQALAHDMSVSSILAPGSSMQPGSVAPKAQVRNLGANPESNIPVTCWIDSGATRVYTATGTVTGPVAPGATADFTFTPDWNPGPAGASYSVTMFTGLVGDLLPANDTARGTTQITGAMISDTIVVKRLADFGPTIDGVLSPGEWAASNQYDISDVMNRGGGGSQPRGTVYAYYLYDAAEGFMYFGVDYPTYTGRIDYDQFGPYLDENRSGTWSTDSSEGNYWCEVVGGVDDCTYRALLSTLPDVWVMGPTPGAVVMSTTTSGHLQYECKIPFGTEKYQLTIQPGDTIGYFQYAQGGGAIKGWWPSTLSGGSWANPAFYGMMVFDPVPVGVETPQAGSQFSLYKATPSVVRNSARIGYYVGRQSNVELGVYDVSGKLVKTLAQGTMAPGEQTATWNRTDNNGRRVSGGTYFYRLTVDGKSVSGKAVLLD